MITPFVFVILCVLAPIVARGGLRPTPPEHGPNGLGWTLSAIRREAVDQLVISTTTVTALIGFGSVCAGLGTTIPEWAFDVSFLTAAANLLLAVLLRSWTRTRLTADASGLAVGRQRVAWSEVAQVEADLANLTIRLRSGPPIELCAVDEEQALAVADLLEQTRRTNPASEPQVQKPPPVELRDLMRGARDRE